MKIKLPRSKKLFRSSRPDYIETAISSYVSGMFSSKLFRSSRPDYIETLIPGSAWTETGWHCSGLPDRTTLRQQHVATGRIVRGHCSGLPDRTTLRHHPARECFPGGVGLFRSSRPDYIETLVRLVHIPRVDEIVPVFQTGLH